MLFRLRQKLLMYRTRTALSLRVQRRSGNVIGMADGMTGVGRTAAVQLPGNDWFVMAGDSIVKLTW